MSKADHTALVRRFLAALERLDLPGLESELDPDTAFVLPFAPPGIPHESLGRPRVLKFLASLGDFLAAPTIEVDRIDSLDGDVNELVAEYRSHSPVRDSDHIYRNTYIARVSVRDGRITRWVEYFDPQALTDAIASRSALQ